MRTPNTGGGTDTISYPIDLLRSVANQILTNLSLALDEHNTKWNAIVDYVDNADYNLQDPMRKVFNAHRAKLEASYQWQADFAGALLGIADLAEAWDDHTAQSFRPPSSGPSHGPSHLS